MISSTTIFVAIAMACASAAAPSAPGHEGAISFHELITDAAGKMALTDGAPNGRYDVLNETRAAYYGIGEATSINPTTLAKRDAFGQCDVSCNGQQADANLINSAQQGLEGWFGSGLDWSHQIVFFAKPVYALGCDYGKGQRTTAGNYVADMGCVNAQCGGTGGGWNNHHGWKATYGREFGSLGC